MNNEKNKKCCKEEGCRCWIDFPEDDNCINVAISKHGAMTLAEIAKRLGISLVRVSQIEKTALAKLSKRIKM
tara:strand:- start:403 stop:618 length:216 start_codon:yes stop_codon:yes gene_type:complete